MKKLLIALCLIVSTAAFAAGGSHGSVSDLIFPAINFSILMGLLIFLSKNNLKAMFNQKAEDVEYLFEHAEKRDKEARIQLEMFQKKMQNLENEKSKILKNAQNEAQNFVEKSKGDSKVYLNRLAKDSMSKIEFEKKSLEDEIRESLVNEVLTKAKGQIRADKELSNKATKKLISQVR